MRACKVYQRRIEAEPGSSSHECDGVRVEMKAPGEEPCFTVALYGITLEHVDFVPLVRDVIDVFRAAGHSPSHLGTLTRGFGEKPLRFARAWKRMEKTHPGDVEVLGLYSLVEDWATVDDWTAICSINQRRWYFSLGAGLVGMPDAEAAFFDFVRRWQDRLRPAYGIGFTRRRDQGPNFYTVGISFSVGVHSASSGPEYEEDLATCRWSDGMHEAVYDQGILRDVYRYSLLKPCHLQRDIDGRPLWAWIQEKPQRGQLAPFDESGDYTMWTVAPEHLATVRRQLAAAGGLYVLERMNHL